MAPSPLIVIEPFPISYIAGHYLLYDVDVVTHIRRQYNICGVLLGSLPQIPQQSVFLGLPLHLMPEEARLLVEQGHAYIVDDARAHKVAILESGLNEEEKRAFKLLMRKQGRDAAEAVKKQAGERKEKALTRVAMERRKQRASSTDTDATSSTLDEEESLFSTVSQTDETASTISAGSMERPTPFAITPTTSHPLITHADTASHAGLPEVPSSYSLFKHLHKKGYFMSPGLRFGCQYTVYPGDPLRFHSHFLAVGKGWNDSIRMMEIVGGGRLGTGVKKGFMLGGEVNDSGEQKRGEGEDVRAFCFEWAGM